jgi:flagellar biosynthesis/type III secretory pathway chaperone
MGQILDQMDQILKDFPDDISQKYHEIFNSLRNTAIDLDKQDIKKNSIIKEYLQIKFQDECECKKRRNKWDDLEKKKGMFNSIWDDIEEIIRTCLILNLSNKLEVFDGYIENYIEYVVCSLIERKAHDEKIPLPQKKSDIQLLKDNIDTQCDYMLKRPDVTNKSLRYCYEKCQSLKIFDIANEKCKSLKISNEVIC